MVTEPGIGPRKAQCDVLIRNAHVLTVDGQRRVFNPGAIAVVGRNIAAVGREAEVVAGYEAAATIDARGGLVHPGYIDPHNHVILQQLRGTISPEMNLGQPRVRFADVKAAMDGSDEYASSALACVELLRHGFTGFVEPGTALEPDAVVKAAEAVKVRGLVTEPYLWDNVESLKNGGGLYSESLLQRAPSTRERAVKLLEFVARGPQPI